MRYNENHTHVSIHTLVFERDCSYPTIPHSVCIIPAGYIYISIVSLGYLFYCLSSRVSYLFIKHTQTRKRILMSLAITYSHTLQSLIDYEIDCVVEVVH